MDFQNILNWISENKNWVFDGIGVTAIGLIASLFFRSKKDGNINQSQTGGNNSFNNQSADSITSSITINGENKDAK